MEKKVGKAKKRKLAPPRERNSRTKFSLCPSVPPIAKIRTKVQARDKSSFTFFILPDRNSRPTRIPIHMTIKISTG